ncbi:trypsin-like peptidase domain-containing protein [Pyxidicoccus parkwayensis]|uniref:Serine protease n=1 Tax=Pyxidicoccus parkwayensis TaxID=2813578 RepID=A0ABX7NSM8_9BACT|nr:serine protease [Pyxidicoccus parkwaysis]QSQ21785.1 trypsin-like peptidase domain-containing protein [Pyxidicoccus parkwaysis]
MSKQSWHFSFKALALLSAGTVALAGCGGGLESDVSVEALGSTEQRSICGTTTDWSDVEPWAVSRGGAWGAFVLRSQRAVGLVRRRSTGAAQCTGSLIAENLFLTAGHCFTNAADATNYDVVFDFQVDSAGNNRTTTTVQIAEGLELVNSGGVDFAVVRLASAAGSTFGSLSLQNSLPTGTELLGIPQHPSGLRKKYHEGHYAGRLANGQITYTDLDTEGGSSGSPVLGSFGTVVGVHTTGLCTSTGGTNRATSMVDVFANSTVVPALVTFRAGGNSTSQGRITLSSGGQSCTRSGNFDDMKNGCALRLTAGDVVTVSCTTNGQSSRWLDSLWANGATLNFTSSSDTSATATFTYTGTGVQVSCSFTD